MAQREEVELIFAAQLWKAPSPLEACLRGGEYVSVRSPAMVSLRALEPGRAEIPLLLRPPEPIIRLW